MYNDVKIRRVPTGKTGRKLNAQFRFNVSSSIPLMDDTETLCKTVILEQFGEPPSKVAASLIGRGRSFVTLELLP